MTRVLYKLLQFEDELVNLFIGNNTIDENDVDSDTHLAFMDSFNTYVLLDPTDMVDELKIARNKKLKESSEETPTRSKNTVKGEIISVL